jgi:glycosyltransferase involved in cell wall biosynthesis
MTTPSKGDISRYKSDNFIEATDNLPSVSFVTCTFNSAKLIGECLNSIATLDYPQHLIEIVIVDGGSTDGTLEIVKKFNCKIIEERTGRPEAATAIGYNKATRDIIVNFPSDNVITSKDWLRRMVAPFIINSEIAGVETCHYEYVKNDTLLNRYFSLFGAGDPIPYYLGKRDRITYFEQKKWPLKAKAIDRGDYYEVEFNESDTPTIGANGFLIRKDLAKLVSKTPFEFFHIDACLDLIKMGHNKYAFVKNGIWHKTGERFVPFLRRKLRYSTIYFNDKALRRYHTFDPQKDKLKLVLFIVLSFTFIEPLSQSIRGYIKIRDRAWFLHPILCPIVALIYGYSFIRFRVTGLFRTIY